jgi:ornithine--oxo-acid transaminase
MNSDDYIELEEKYGAHNYHPLDIVISRGEGVWAYDVDGKRYLDCLSAYSAFVKDMFTPRYLGYGRSPRKLT